MGSLRAHKALHVCLWNKKLTPSIASIKALYSAARRENNLKNPPPPGQPMGSFSLSFTIDYIRHSKNIPFMCPVASI